MSPAERELAGEVRAYAGELLRLAGEVEQLAGQLLEVVNAGELDLERLEYLVELADDLGGSLSPPGFLGP